MAKGLSALREEVLDTGVCTACGTCVSLCPNIMSLHDRIGIVGDCTVESGRCYSSCPRTIPQKDHQESIFGDVGYKGAVGVYMDYCIARSASGIKQKFVQYGGVVTTLLSCALENGMITSAVVTGAEGDRPIPLTAHTKNEVEAAAGTKFAIAPTNKEANRMLRNVSENNGVVALPCQATGLQKRQISSYNGDITEGKVSIIIGLFCTWALSQDGWRSLVDSLGADTTVQRADIPPPPASNMRITSDTGVHEIPLDTVRESVRDGCKVCLDLTAENADLSVGMVEGRDECNTVIVRTARGKKLMDSAINSGLIKTEVLDEDRWNHLTHASINKKKQAAVEAKARGAHIPYYSHVISIQSNFIERNA